MVGQTTLHYYTRFWRGVGVYTLPPVSNIASLREPSMFNRVAYRYGDLGAE